LGCLSSLLVSTYSLLPTLPPSLHPFFSTSPPPFLPSPSFLPLPLSLSRGPHPLKPVRGLAERCELPNGSGQSPGRQMFCVHSEVKNRPLASIVSSVEKVYRYDKPQLQVTRYTKIWGVGHLQHKFFRGPDTHDTHSGCTNASRVNKNKEVPLVLQKLENLRTCRTILRSSRSYGSVTRSYENFSSVAWTAAMLLLAMSCSSLPNSESHSRVCCSNEVTSGDESIRMNSTWLWHGISHTSSILRLHQHPHH